MLDSQAHTATKLIERLMSTAGENEGGEEFVNVFFRSSRDPNPAQLLLGDHAR